MYTPTRFIKKILRVLGCIVIGYIVFTTFLIHLANWLYLRGYSFIDDSIVLASIWSVRHIIELMFTWFGIDVLGLFFTPMGAYWFVGVVFSLISIIGFKRIYLYVKKRNTNERKSFPWVYAVFLTYSLSVIIFSYDFKPKIEWYAPAFNLSTYLEKKQMGPFYKMTSYYSADEGSLFRYDMIPHEDGFKLYQNTDTLFVISDIQSVESFKVSKSKKSFLPLRHANEFMSSTHSISANPREFSYKETLLFLQRTGITANSMVVNSTGEWVLVQFDEILSPDTVYLVDVRGT